MRISFVLLVLAALLTACGARAPMAIPSGLHAGAAPTPMIEQSGPPPVHWMQLTPSFQSPMSPSDITVGPDGNMWLADARNGVVRVDMAGNFTLYPLSFSNLPLQITGGFDNDLWFTGGVFRPWISRITTTGNITQYALNNSSSWGKGIARGPHKTIWFTDPGGFAIGRIDSNADITEFPLNNGSDPLEIIEGPDGNMWFTDSAGYVGRVTPQGAITEFPLANHPSSIAVGPDGNLWVTAGISNYVYEMSTSGTVVGQIQIGPSDVTLAGDVVAGPDRKAMWVGVSTPYYDALEKIQPDGFITEYPLAGSTFDRMAIGPDKNVWTINAGRPTINVFIREPLNPTPSSIQFASTGQERVVTVSEPGYHGPFAAASSNMAVATVVAGPNSDQFTVTSQGSGSCTVTVSDKRQNSYAVGVTVP